MHELQEKLQVFRGESLTLALSAVDIALWDVVGKAAGAPLHPKSRIAPPGFDEPAAAGALAEGGLRVAVVEHALVGGECSYWACIPSKTLLRPGEAAHGAREAAGFAEVDVAAALAWRDFTISGYSDSRQVRWLAQRGIDLLRVAAGWMASGP